MTSLGAVSLHFNGPLSFSPGERSIFHCDARTSSCVYLWTIRSAVNQRYYIHYVGEAASFAKRQRDHLVHILGLNYGMFDPDSARQGVSKLVWRGLWRDRSADGPGRTLAEYVQMSSIVEQYLAALNVFVAPLDADRALRRHVEGSIAWDLRRNHPDDCALYPADNHVGVGRTPRSMRLLITSDLPIAGLADSLDI